MTNSQIVIAGVVLCDKQNRYLLVQEKKPKVRGLWNLPAGHVDKGETIQQAAIRETLEEVGIRVKLLSDKPVLVDDITEPNIKKYSFLCEVVGGSLKINYEELLDAKWLGIDDIKRLHEDNKLRTDWVLNSIMVNL